MTQNSSSAPIVGYRYDVNLLPDMDKLTPYLRKYLQVMGWKDLNWLEDVHMGFEEGRPAVFDRNINGWVTVPEGCNFPTTSSRATWWRASCWLNSKCRKTILWSR